MDIRAQKMIDLHIQQFLDYAVIERRLSAKTQQAYGSDLSQFASYLKDAGIKKPGEIDENILLGYADMLTSQHLRPASLARKMTVVRSFIKYLIGLGHVSGSCLDSIPNSRPPRVLPKHLNVDEIARLLSAPAPRVPRPPCPLGEPASPRIAGHRGAGLLEFKIYSCLRLLDKR